MSPYHDLNILFSSHYSENYISVPEFSSRQVNCGPFCVDKHDGIRQLSLKTPLGHYDIQSIITKLPNDQKPELLIVKSDATKGNHPINIRSLSIPKLLIIGDTMHQRRPIQTMLDYATEQNFDYYVADHVRRHLHFFREVGINAHWFPGVLVRTWGGPFREKRNINLSFVGQAGRFHPHRRLLLDQLKQDKFGILETLASQHQASMIYAQSLITLNLSMMGDINLRVFEVLSSGGFLITDNISPQAGNGLLFKDQEHLVIFNNYEDLKDKISYYIQNPKEVLSIARQGYQEFWKNHSPEEKRKQLFNLVFENKFPPSFDGNLDKRSVSFPSKSKEQIAHRVHLYEYVQSIHRIRDRLAILFLANSDQQFLSDLVDLPRCELFCACPLDENLINSGVSNQINNVNMKNMTNNPFEFDITVVGSKFFSSTDQIDCLKEIKAKQILIADRQFASRSYVNAEIDGYIKDLGYISLKHDGLIVYHLINTR